MNAQVSHSKKAQTPVVAVIILSFIGVLIVAGVSALVLVAFNSSTTNGTAETVYSNGLLMLANFTGQLGTAGTIAGVLILVVLVSAAGIGLASYGRKKGFF